MARGLHRVAILAVVVAASTTSCIGATDRAAFDAEVRARGGGVAVAWIAAGIDLVAAEVGASGRSDLSVMSLRIEPTDRTLIAIARRNDQPEFVDTVVIREGELVSISPVQDVDRLPLDDITFTVGDLPIDRLEELGDAALAEFGERDGYVNAISVTIRNDEPVIEIFVESARRAGSVLFDQSGTYIEVVR